MIVVRAIPGLSMRIFHLHWNKSYPTPSGVVNSNSGMVSRDSREAAGPLAMHGMTGPASFVIAVALAISSAACGSGENGVIGGPETTSVHGLLQEVEARSLLEIGSLTVRDDDGRDWVIEGGGTEISGFSPSHVREHMVLGQPVTVFLHREDGVLVLEDITD